MGKIMYYKRVVEGKIKELHYQEDKGEYTKGKSYPECQDSFNESEMEEMELNEWLDVGLENNIFKSEDLTPRHSC